MFRCETSQTLLSLLFFAGLAALCVGQGSWRDQNYDLYADTDYEDPSANLLPSKPIVYRPVPQRPAPAPKDPNVILVPRLGNVRGTVGQKIIKNRAIKSFLGLQYGSIRPGLGRFQKADVPVIDSSRIIDATTEPKPCYQFPNLPLSYEDQARGTHFTNCLYVNVHAPNTTGLLPVMVYVHGEMLFDGSAEEAQPDYLLEQDVVLVSVSYRLAPFGFLTTLTDELPGNVALADIQMALEWVQQYIRAFGGNADQVTLFGQAGGATLVHALSLSGKAQGTFHKLILQSGTAMNPYFLDEDPLSFARSLVRLARCPIENLGLQSLLNCFERLSNTDLLEAFKRHWLENELRGVRYTGGFKLVVGDKLGYLPKHPAALLAENKYPLVAGVTKDAGAFIMSRFYKQLFELRTRNISDYINIVLKHTTQPRQYAIWKHWALQHIFNEEDVRNPTLPSLAQGLLELTNLILYRAPLIDSIRYTSRQYPTYLYCFDYRGEFHRFGHLSNPLPFEADATLSDENIYLFPYPVEVSQLNRADKIVANLLTGMWTNFATYNVPHLSAGSWPNVSNEFGPFVRISNMRAGSLELDYHFGEGIPVPNLHPEYFTTTTTSTTTKPTTSTTTTTTLRPYPYYANDPNDPYYAHYQPPRSQPAYLAHEHVLNDPYPANHEQNPDYLNNLSAAHSNRLAEYIREQQRYRNPRI